MMKIAFLLTLAVALLACLLPIAPAQAAGAARTFVSAAGSDSNSCTNVATPCRHLANAYAATAPGGEIDVLDPGNYGALYISHAVSVQGHGWTSISATSGQPAISITASAGDMIYIRGVVLDGGGLDNDFGILLGPGGNLNLEDSVIRNFGEAGIVYEPGSSSTLSVSNTLVSDNFEGIDIFPSGPGTTTAILDHVKIEHNTNYGLQVNTSSQPNISQSMNVTVSDSVVAYNQNGIAASSPEIQPINMMVRNSIIANNMAGIGLWAVFDNAVIRVTRSTITGNSVAFKGDSGGAVLSYGDNNIDANANTISAPTKIGEQ